MDLHYSGTLLTQTWFTGSSVNSYQPTIFCFPQEFELVEFHCIYVQQELYLFSRSLY